MGLTWITEPEKKRTACCDSLSSRLTNQSIVPVLVPAMRLRLQTTVSAWFPIHRFVIRVLPMPQVYGRSLNTAPMGARGTDVERGARAKITARKWEECRHGKRVNRQLAVCFCVLRMTNKSDSIHPFFFVTLEMYMAA
jgi:hypothetical protein